MITENPKISTIPAGLSFGDTLAQMLLDGTKNDPLALSDILVLLPSRRACRTIRDAFLRLTHGRPTVLPKLQPLGDVDPDELSLSFPEAQDTVLNIPPAIHPLQRDILLAKTILKLHDHTQERPRFDQALQLAAELSKFLDDVQTEGVSFDALHDLVPEKFAAHWQITLSFLTILTQNWPDILKAYNVIDPAARRNELLRAQAEAWTQHPPQTPVIAAGTIGSVPATREVLKAILQAPQGEVILPGLDQTLDDASWSLIAEDHPQHFMKQFLETLDVDRHDVRVHSNTPHLSLKSAFFSEVTRPATTSHLWQNLGQNPLSEDILNGLQTLTFDTLQEEAEAIALIIREKLEAPDKTIAVVTPNRNLARRISAALKRWDIFVDDTGGTPLQQTLKGRWALSVAEMIYQDFSATTFLSTLKNPLLALKRPLQQRRDLTERLERSNLRGVQKHSGLSELILDVEKDLKEKIKKGTEDNTQEQDDLVSFLIDLQTVTTPLSKLRTETHSFNHFLKTHIECLENLATTYERSGADMLWQEEDGEALSLCLSDLIHYGRDIPKITFDQYLTTLRHFLSQNIVRPKYGTHPRISILGQIESRLFVADTMILSSLNEGDWPRAHTPDPWMSRSMRYDFGLPAREQTIGISAHDFVQIASAPHVILTRAKRSDGTPRVPSRWLLRLETVLSAMGYTIPEENLQTYKTWRTRLDMPDHFQNPSRPAPCPPIAARPNTLSVTGVERLMRDPYEVYAKYILKLRALDPIDADPSAADRGQILHLILEKFVSAYPKDLPKNAAEILYNLGEEHFAAQNIPEDIKSFWWPRFEQLIPQYLKHEKNWRAQLTPQATEVKGHITLKTKNGESTITAIADRIDLHKDGTGAIIDYKTGSTPTKQDVLLGYSPQMMLEALILSSGGFAEMTAIDPSYIGFWILSGASSNAFESKLKIEEIEKEITQAEQGVTRLLNHFLSPETPYIARPNAKFIPTYSDFEHLERTSEWIYDTTFSIEKVGDAS